jgi:hypothetical protein
VTQSPSVPRGGFAAFSLFSMRVLRRLAVLVGVCSVTLSGVAQAQTSDTDEWAMRIKTAQVMGVLGENLFGDQTNYYNGQTSFRQVDVSLPGNSKLPVEIARTLTVKTADGSLAPRAFQSWDLDVPYMSGVFAQSSGWQVSSTTPNNRCSGAAAHPAPPMITVGSASFRANEYWRSNSLHIPGAGDQTLLAANSSSAHPSNGQTTALITSQFWQLQCTTTLAAGNSGFSGEGFNAISPDGVQYRFDWMVSLPFEETVQTYAGSSQVLARLSRSEIRIYPTQVTDRFGNWVRYTWSGSRLTQIQASDGRPRHGVA